MTAWVFIDLDGTLTDAAPGITAAIAHALKGLGITPPDRSVLSGYIGPALQETFPKLGVDDLDAAMRLYRAHYTDGGMFNAEVYGGAPEMMAVLRERGYQLALATAKPLAYAPQITAHFGLDAALTRQFGSELDGTRTDKRDLLAHALSETGADPAKSFMIGDRMHDARGAVHNGIAMIGALWGFGSAEELTEAGAAALAERPADVPDLIDRLAESRT